MVQVRDPKVAPSPWYARHGARFLEDPRDVVFLGLMAQCFAFAACGLALFFVGRWVWYLAPLYWAAFFFGFSDRFVLMVHCTSHRSLFSRPYRWANLLIPWVLGPFFGLTPETYYSHHVGMHHPEENLDGDASTTARYQRDRLTHWLRYWARFLVLGLPELCLYMIRRRRWPLLRRILAGEGVYWALIVSLATVQLDATLVVFVIPLVLMRTVLMLGNWAQHAFLSGSHPTERYLASTTCIDCPYNARNFNDGYHIGHHFRPRLHWTEYPADFEVNAHQYGLHDAVVFRGIDFATIWFFLMTKRWEKLADAFVQLPGAPSRSRQEIIALLQERVRPLEAS